MYASASRKVAIVFDMNNSIVGESEDARWRRKIKTAARQSVAGEFSFRWKCECKQSRK